MTRRESECHVFAKWGCHLGVGVPIALIMLYDLFGGHRYFQSTDIFPRHVIGLGIVTILVASLGSYFAKHWYSKCAAASLTEKRVDVFLYGVGVATCILLGIIVAYTGGVLLSPFSYYFLYLPSIVAVSFTPNPASKGRGLIVVSLTCAIMIAVGLFNAGPISTEYKAFCESLPRKIAYFIIAAIQFLAIILIERKEQT